MDIQIDLRRPDFEAMHPTAKLFGFNEEAKMYFGELDSSTNKQWTTWCACLGMLHLEAGRSKEVPESNALLSASLDAIQKLGSGDFVLVPKEPTEKMIEAGHAKFEETACGPIGTYKAMIEAQEQSHE